MVGPGVAAGALPGAGAGKAIFGGPAPVLALIRCGAECAFFIFEELQCAHKGRALAMAYIAHPKHGWVWY